MLDTLWLRLLKSLETRLPATVLDSWVRPSRLIAVEGDLLKIGAPNKFSRDWLAEHHLEALHAAAKECLGGQPRVAVIIDETASADFVASPEDSPPVAAPRGTAPEATLGQLNPRYTFDAFVVGSSNQFAQAAGQAVAELPSRAYNPLFIYGGVGLGKTHLLHAVGHQTLRLFPHMAVVYLSSERFTNDLINAIRYDRTAEFRAKYRTIDLLLIDDIQFISGKERTQEELFHTFNELHESHRQIVISSDRSPKEIPEIEERLRSRFEWGLIADIHPPDFETRVAILKKKAELDRVPLPDDLAYFIANKVKSNIRELEGSLVRLRAFCSLTGRELSLDLAQEVLANIWGSEERLITTDGIQRRVSEVFGVKPHDLRSRIRTKAVAFPRQVAMYLARQLTSDSFADIGRSFGGKDHTTVLYAAHKIESLLQEDLKFRKTLDHIINTIPIE